MRDVSLAPGWMEHVVYAFASPATALHLGAPSGFNELQFRLRDAHASRADVRRVAQAVQTLAQQAGAQVLRVEVPEPGEHIHAAQMNSLLLTQGAFGVLALLVCSFVVVNLFNTLLAGQAREIAVMKTLGASSAQLSALYLGQALLLGGLAIALALPLAAWAGWRYAVFKGELLNLPIDGYSIPAWAWAVQLALGCALPLLAAALPVRQACRQTVGAALRDIGIMAPGRALALRRLWLPAGWARPALLSLANAFRRRQRLALTLLALATAGAVQLGAANLRVAVGGSVEQLFAAQAFDVSLRFTPAQPAAALLATALAVDGVAKAEAWRGQRVTLAGDVDGEAFALLGVPSGSLLLRPTVTAGRWLQPGDADALVVSRMLLRQRPELTPGASVDLLLGERRARWLVVGVVEAGPQPLAYTSITTLNSLAGDTLASTLAVALNSKHSALQLDTIARLRSALQDAGMAAASSQRQAENRRVVEDHLLMVVDFLAAMAWLMLAIAAMGLASSMGMAVLERRREIGVLRALGASRRALAGMVHLEGLLIVALAWCISLPLSVLTSVLLGQAFGRVMFAVPIILWPHTTAALRWLLLGLGICVLACAVPAWRASRVPVARALSYG